MGERSCLRPRRGCRSTASLALFLLAVTAALTAQVPDANLQSGLRAISPAEAYDIVKTLALPEYAGRLTGHPGYTAAAQWAAEWLAARGLKPISVRQGFLQPYL